MTEMDHSAAADTREPQVAPEEEALAMRRALSNTLELPRLCLARRCRRSRRCKGDAYECLAVGEALLSPDVIAGARFFLAGKIEGLSFDEVYAEVPELIEAYAQWSGRIAPMRPARR